MVDLEEFHHQLLADVQGDADVDGLIPVEAFFELCEGILSEAGEIDGGTRSYFQGTYRRKKFQVDGYGGDPRQSNGVLSLIICDFSVTDSVRRMATVETKAIFSKLVEFLRVCRITEFKEQLEETSDGYGLADLISTTWKSVDKIKLIFVSNADNRAKVDARTAGTIDGKPITYNIWDLKRLQKFMEQGQTREDLSIDFENDYGGAIPILPASGGGSALETYLAVIPGSQLAEIYEKWGARLLESNVRSFLQARGNVNKGIRNTIVTEPHMFLAYNNGISATADGLEVVRTENGLVMSTVDNLQIVNGGQTTASLHAARKVASDQMPEVFVQMKLSIVPPEKAEGVVPKISEYANSQNKVNAADFFANHPFHVRMEELSRRLLAPAGTNGYRETKWFYERARGQYADQKSRLTPAAKKKWDAEYPRSQFFTKTDLAKYENTFQCLPYVVSLGAQKNFAKFASYIGSRWGDSGFSFDEIWFRKLIAKAIIFKRLEKLVSAAEWYEGGYRANIVTYAIAKLVHDTTKAGNLIDLDSVWRMQEVPSALEQALMVSGAEAQNVILDPIAVRNIGEWAKKQAAWKILSERKLDYGDDLVEILIAPEEVKSSIDNERKDMAEQERVIEMTRVFELGSKFWSEVLIWGRSKRALSPREVSILTICSQIPEKLPTERQSELALKAVDKLLGLGYSHEALEHKENE